MYQRRQPDLIVCSPDAKDQRDEMMAKLKYELKLAKKVTQNQHLGNVPAFYI
jgi:hypothetical protein